MKKYLRLYLLLFAVLIIIPHTNTLADEEAKKGTFKNLYNCEVYDIPDMEYTGNYIKPLPEIYYEGKKLTYKTDYILSYQNNLYATNSMSNYNTSVIITGTGSYVGSITIPFKIIPKRISDKTCTIKMTEESAYTNKANKVNIQVSVDNINLKENNDFIVEYYNNKDVGIATAKIKFVDNYTGNITKKFYITPKAPSSINKKLVNASSLKITWTKVNKCNGYKIQKYNAKTKKYETIKTINDSNTTNYTLNNLAVNENVKLQISSFAKYEDGTTHYGLPKTYTFKVVIPVNNISLKYISSSSIKLAINQFRTLTLNISPNNAHNKKVIWSSSDNSIATVDSKGKVTGIAKGTATITAMAADGSGIKKSIKVNVTARANSFKISESKLTIVSTSHQKYTYSEMATDITQLKNKYSEFITVRSLGTSYDKRNIYNIILGNLDAPNKLLVIGSTHARAYMTTQRIMKQIELYCSHYFTGIYDKKYFSEILDETCIYFVPMLNPDGVTISQSGPFGINNPLYRNKVIKMCNTFGKGNSNYYTRWKANVRGVDLNQNNPALININNGVTSPRSEGYKGSFPASEKESKLLINLFKEIKPNAVCSYHATGSIIYWKYGQSGTQLKKSEKLFNVTNKLTGYTPVSSVSKGAGFSNWTSSIMKTPSMTIEIGVNPCPLKITEFPSIWTKNKYVPVAQAHTINNF